MERRPTGRPACVARPAAARRRRPRTPDRRGRPVLVGVCDAGGAGDDRLGQRPRVGSPRRPGAPARTGCSTGYPFCSAPATTGPRSTVRAAVAPRPRRRRQRPGMRRPDRAVLDSLVPAILEQKVTGQEAWRSGASCSPVRRARARPGDRHVRPAVSERWRLSPRGSGTGWRRSAAVSARSAPRLAPPGSRSRAGRRDEAIARLGRPRRGALDGGGDRAARPSGSRRGQRRRLPPAECGRAALPSAAGSTDAGCWRCSSRGPGTVSG